MCLKGTVFTFFGVTHLSDLQIEAVPIRADDWNRISVQQFESVLCLLVRYHASRGDTAQGLVHETRECLNSFFSGFSGHAVWQPCCLELVEQVQ